MFPSFFFFLCSAFFCLSFSSLPLLFDILKPKICPPDEVFGKKRIPAPVPPFFSKKAMPWGKKWPVQMNLPFFAVKAYVPGGGSRIRPKKIRKMPSGRYRYKNLLLQYTPPPVALQGVATPPVAALSAVSRVSQGCRSCTPFKGPSRTPSWTPL